ncbi:MAG: AI-2E family transporter [Erysipelothrix sp.]|nr:AI-2E family transporter [Erysipelothrix sp.]
MKHRLSAFEKKQVIKYVIAGSILVLFYFVMRNLDNLWSVLATLFRILTPFMMGYGISFLLLPLEKIIKGNLPLKKEKTKQVVAVFLSTIFALLAFAMIILFILPGLISSIITVSEQFPSLIASLQGFYESIEINENIAEFIQNSITQAQEFLINTLQSSITNVLSGAMDFTNILFNSFLAITVSIYVSLDREFFSRNAKKVSLALLGREITGHLTHFTRISSRVFKQYFYSKGASSLLLGFFAFVVLSMFSVKYALLIATVFGLFNLIPLFGFVISMFIIVIFLMLVQIKAVLTTVIVLVILKLIENVFVTKTLFGEPVSLPTFWVLIALILGNYSFGILGLFISVPIFTIFYISIQNWVENRKERVEADEH